MKNKNIKYRVWDKKLNRMGEVGLINFKLGLVIYSISPNSENYYFAFFDECELMPSAIWTDQNGKEIFDKDILRAYHEDTDCQWITSVKFFEGCFRVNVEGMQYEQTSISWAMDDDIEFTIIGNEIENPELIPIN